MNAMALLALKAGKRLKMNTSEKKHAGETKIETVNPTAEILPSNLSQTFASGSTAQDILPRRHKGAKIHGTSY